MSDFDISDEELKETEKEIKAFEIDYQQQYGRYDLNDFTDLINWARELKVKDPNHLTDNERLAVTIRLLYAQKIGNSVAYKVFRKLYYDLRAKVNAK